MHLTIVIPAFNEESQIAGCLASVRRAVSEVGGRRLTDPLAVTVVVCDNNSTDATAELARRAGAEVVFEPVNQISRARNRGAEAAPAATDWLLFIDADSRLAAVTLEDMLAAIERGGLAAIERGGLAEGGLAGGGATVRLEPAPAWGRLMMAFWNALSRLARWAAGSFVFCRADAFRDIGGFSEELYAAEEIDFSRRLERWGRERGLRFTILTRHPHASSGRKLYLYSRWELVRLILQVAVRPFAMLKSRAGLGYFYDGRR